MELERQHMRSDAAREAAERHVDELSTIHEDQMRHLHEQHEKDIALLKHQHDQHVRTLKQGYEVKIQNLLEDQHQRVKTLRQNMDETNQKAIHSAISRQQHETETAVNSLKKKLSKELADMNSAYARQAQELDEHKAALEQSESRRMHLEGERSKLETQFKESRQQAEEATSKAYDAVDNLAVTEAKLKTLKKEYQNNLRDLANAMKVSKEHIQANYEVISSLKEDKTRMKNDLEHLKDEMSRHDQDVKSCQREKHELKKKIKNFEIDAKSYHEEITRLRQLEGHHTASAAKAGQAIESHQTRIHQCKIALKEAHEAMQQEKEKHLSLRKDYQDHVDRLSSLNSALDKCKQKNIHTNEVLQNMSDRYEALRKKSKKAMDELERLTEEKQSYQSDLKKEQARLEKLQNEMKLSRQEMEETLHRSEANQKHAFQLLDTCQQKGSSCLRSIKKRDEYVAKLEAEIKRAMKILKDDEAVRRKAKRLDEVVSVRDSELEKLRAQLSQLKKDNHDLKTHVSDFEAHREMDERMLQKHTRLKNQHARAVQWISEMKKHHKDLHKQETKVGKALEQTGRQLDESEDKMQHSAKIIRQLEEEIQKLKDRMAKCLYPGEKERLEEQITSVIKERDSLRDSMSKAVVDHDAMNKKMQALMKENEDLRVLKSRYEMDTQQMQKIVEQGAELNVELVKSKKLISKKDRQLELLSHQLGTLIHRVKTLEEREGELTDKMQYLSSPEEVEALTHKLMNCRSEQKKAMVKFEAVKTAADNMAEQNRLNQDKVSSLVQVLKESEDAQKQLREERVNRIRLEEALRDCAKDRKLSSEQLEARIKAVEDQYRHNLVSHEKMMAESKARIADLEEQLARAGEIERNTRLQERLDAQRRYADMEEARRQNELHDRALLERSREMALQRRGGGPEYVSPETEQALMEHDLPPRRLPPRVSQEDQRKAEAEEASKGMMHRNLSDLSKKGMVPSAQVKQIERDADLKIRELQAQLAALKEEQRQLGPSPEPAIRSAHLESARKLQELRDKHKALMREKEREIMLTRSQTYDNLLSALETANKNPSTNPDDLYSQIRDIRTRGAEREQQAMADMLQLRAVNQKLATQYKAARAMQWDMLHQANLGQRNHILATASGASGKGGADNLYRQAQAYQALVGAQQDYISSQRQDVTSQLRDQQQYIQELQNQLPKMHAIENRINLTKFPNLNVLKQQVQKERKIVIGSVGQEKAEAEGYSRSRSSLESQLAANDASVRGMIDQIQRYMKSPTEDNLSSLREMAQMSPGQIQDVMQRQKALHDRSAVRSTVVIPPRTENMGPPGKHLAVDTSTGEVQIKPHSLGKNDLPHRFFASDVSLFAQPKKTFAPVVSRTMQQLQRGEELVAVTYSFDSGGQGPNGQSLKYIVFMHALKELFPRIQSLSPNGTINVQLVKIVPNEYRQDLITPSHAMAQACTYRTCAATMRTLSNVDSAMKIMGALGSDFDAGSSEAENHIVMTLSVPDNPSRIHIADVLYLPTDNTQVAVPPPEQIKLLDSSWITYLSDVLQDPKTKIDLFFNILPHPEGDSVTSESNDRLMQVSKRLQDFLSQLKSSH